MPDGTQTEVIDRPTLGPEWSPELDGRGGPRYRAIAEAMEDDIRTGRLPAGAKLPTHRDLAWRLGVTVGTITRAYKEATARGLIDGEIGRGTFVRDRRTRVWEPAVDQGRRVQVDMGPNYTPLTDETERAFREALIGVASDPSVGLLSGYHPSGGCPEHRARMADWLCALGARARPEDTLITAGVQHGLAVAFTALFEPGDALAVTRLTHPSAKSLALRRGLRLIPVAGDAQGMDPEALDAACRLARPKGLFLIPTLDNPTATVMPADRRQAIAEVADRHDLTVIEDDVYRDFVPGAAAPLATLIPDRTVYVASASKHLAAGLRVGAMTAPENWRPRLQPTLRDMMWMAPPAMVELLLRWLEDGTADRLAAAKRDEMTARRALAADFLDAWGSPGRRPACTPGSHCQSAGGAATSQAHC